MKHYKIFKNILSLSFVYSQLSTDYSSLVDRLVSAELRKLDREYLFAIYLNSRNKAIDIEDLAIGTLSQVPVHPPQVIKSAILVNAHSFIYG